MVQRKVSNKLGIQADHVKSNKLLVNLKQSSLQHQDSKNRGSDFKKIMKKSRNTKRSDHERMGSSNFRRQVPQPGKPPPTVLPSSAASSPQKKSLTKTSDTTPNYMKSTTSSDARKEQSQVSSRNLQALFDGKISSKKNSNNSEVSSASVHKPTRTLTRTSSLKLVRTLTKTTSFKPSRASAKKCSPLVLSENLNVQRATCSSTLKDSKFPDYLTLNSGATEAEGTSIMKVCPYNYCSLNGHHHPPLPSLKSFLSAKRRTMKAQRSIKLGCLSPRRSKPDMDSLEENYTGQVNFNEKSPNEEEINSLVISPVIQEEHTGFFVQIYSKERENTADINATSNDQLNFNGSLSCIRPSAGGRDEIAEHDDIPAPENVSDTAENSPGQNQNKQAAYEVYSHYSTPEKSRMECLSRPDDEVESKSSIITNDPEFGPSDMDWEIGRYSTFYLDDDADNSLQASQDSDMGGESVEYDSFIVPDESIFRSDETVNGCFEENHAGENQGESSEEESTRYIEDLHQEFETDEYIQLSEYQSDDRLEELNTANEKNNNLKSVDSDEAIVNITSFTLEDPIKALCADTEETNEASKADNKASKLDPRVDDTTAKYIKTEDDDLIDCCENESIPEDYAAEQTWQLDSQDFHYMAVQNLTEESRGSDGAQKNFNLSQFDTTINVSCMNSETFNGSTPHKKNDLQSEKNGLDIEILKTDSGVAVTQEEQVDPVKALIKIEIIISLQGSFEAVKNKPREDRNDNYRDTKENGTQTLAEDLLDGTYNNSYNEKSVSGGIENLNSLEPNEAALKGDSEDQSDSRMVEFPLADNVHQASQVTDMEIITDLGEASSSTSNNISCTGRDDGLVQSNSDQDVAETSKRLNWTNRCKRSIQEPEETNEFNPRAPNFLPVEPEPEAEKVDLRHQMLDERKNSEEWMLDYALQQAVTKLAPARKKKVALLVEAFETVVPPKYETQLRHAPVAFAHARPIQACS